MGHIYCFTNKVNGKKYIGQTICDDNTRYNQHHSNYKNEKSEEYNSKIHQGFREFGFDNFSYEILAKDIQSQELLDELERYYIVQYDSRVPNGYNVKEGGQNGSYYWSEESKEKMVWKKGELSPDEVVELRIAYGNKESPSQIYKEKYADRMTYNAFLNIWGGRRYCSVMPEMIEKGRRIVMSQEKADQVREDYKNEKISYSALAERYGCSKSTISDILKNRIWKKSPTK